MASHRTFFQEWMMVISSRNCDPSPPPLPLPQWRHPLPWLNAFQFGFQSVSGRFPVGFWSAWARPWESHSCLNISNRIAAFTACLSSASTIAQSNPSPSFLLQRFQTQFDLIDFSLYQYLGEKKYNKKGNRWLNGSRPRAAEHLPTGSAESSSSSSSSAVWWLRYDGRFVWQITQGSG